MWPGEYFRGELDYLGEKASIFRGNVNNISQGKTLVKARDRQARVNIITRSNNRGREQVCSEVIREIRITNE